MSIDRIRELNKHIGIKSIDSKEFEEYGRVITGYDFSKMIKYMEENTTIPEEGNLYIASDKAMESLEVCKKLRNEFYGEISIEAGYCNGKNSTLNGLEYHKGSEVNVAVTDLVLLLGRVQDIEDNKYESKKVEAFYLKKGDAIEVYGTTLHFAPCKVSGAGFKAVVILPEGTNTPLEYNDKGKTGEGQLLFAKNKWLLVHSSRKVLIEKGAHIGIDGDNIEMFFK